MGPSEANEPSFETQSSVLSSGSQSSAGRRSPAASFVVSPEMSTRQRSRSNRHIVEDISATTLVTSGIFSTGSDVGAGTAEYIGVCLPHTVKMILSLPGRKHNRSYLLADEEDGELDEANDVEDADKNSALTPRKVGTSTPPVSFENLTPAVKVNIASTPPKDFLLGPPKPTKIGSSVPAIRVASFQLPNAGSFRTVGIADQYGTTAPKVGVVAASFAARGRSDAGFYGAIAAKVRGEKAVRRSSTDVDDALGEHFVTENIGPFYKSVMRRSI